MKRGEIFGYAVYLMKNFVIPNSIKFVFADVMCKLWGFAVKNIPEILETSKGALSVIHAKGHSLHYHVGIEIFIFHCYVKMFYSVFEM